ncbi:hypothetical protein C1645_834751 [Glomus cerebriforme]|uniref:Uncharacterized protein n=1 Tax=Glomus cerebriforme TaxID=658196 RepID=A0A397SJ40_9GLOM|nr:hypothetical protein C1645_834751 [Glomus cerebriforme]
MNVRNNIKKKEDAVKDTTLYNGRKLTTSEKKIFEQASIKDDLVKVQDTAEILEKVIKAKEENVKNDTLLNELKGYRRDKADSVKAINEGNSNQFNIAFTLLESFSIPSGDEETLKKEIKDIEDQITAINNKKKKYESKRKELRLKAGEARRKKRNIANQITALDTTFRSHLVENKKLVDIIALYNTKASSNVGEFEVKFSYYFTDRKFIDVFSLRNVAFDVFDMMREVDKDKLFAYIDSSEVTIPTGSVFTTKKELKDAWDEFLKYKSDTTYGLPASYLDRELELTIHGAYTKSITPASGENDPDQGMAFSSWLKKYRSDQETVKSKASTQDNIEVSEELLDKISRENEKEYFRLSKEKGNVLGTRYYNLSGKKENKFDFKLNKNITDPLTGLPGMVTSQNFTRYLSLDALDDEIHTLELDESEQEVIEEGYKRELNKLLDQEADYNVEIIDFENEKKILQDRLTVLEIKDLPSLKQKFQDLWKSGSPATKYLPAEIAALEHYLKLIGDMLAKQKPEGVTLDTATNLDPEHKGYYDKIVKLKKDLEP